MATLTADNNVARLSGPISLRRKSTTKENKLKNFNIQLDEAGQARVEKIKEQISPSTKTEVFRSSLQLLDAILNEVESESSFYIKRKGDKEPILIEFFE